ncbi:MAG TPA: response regulator transcription factor [Acidimicrobiia bacterium]|nr:response regulator transcription factor [Acidimicrobiia bacterium]
MDVAIFPPDHSEDVAAALMVAGIKASGLSEINAELPGEAAALIVELGDEPLRRLRMLELLATESPVPVLVVADRTQVAMLAAAVGVSDFVLSPPDHDELRLRIHRLTHAAGTDEVHHFKDLELNILTYQAALGGRPLDLTYMEYELLRFFVEHQARVWSREQLLSKVWGYEYYGGARTVDVHVRRLRAKLGEERSSWITTVRSVGYRFG